MADLAPKIKLVLGITDMKDMIDEIDKCSSALERFSNLALSNCESINSNSSRKSQKLAKTFRQVRGLAGSLYSAILDGFRGECHDSHEARLYLDDRIDHAHNGLRQRGVTDHDASRLMFNLAFYAGRPKEDPLYYETAVQVFDGLDTDNVTTGSGSTAASAKSTVTFRVTDDSSAPEPDVATISSICTTIKETHRMKTRISFALLEGGQMGTFPCPNDTPAAIVQPSGLESYGNCVSLSQILQTSSNSIPWKPRLQLSLSLASSLLQLFQTPWLTQAWRKDALFFRVSDAPCGPPSRGKRSAQPDLNRPFVVCNFSGESPEVTATETKAVLLELGIILLEIWHGMTLEAHFGLDESENPAKPTKYFERLAQALEWEADWTNPMPGLFGESVSQCLRGNNVSAGKKLDWEDLNVWSSICGDIIEPLSKLYKNF
jgi:hypothetical protein